MRYLIKISNILLNSFGAFLILSFIIIKPILFVKYDNINLWIREYSVSEDKYLSALHSYSQSFMIPGLVMAVVALFLFLLWMFTSFNKSLTLLHGIILIMSSTFLLIISIIGLSEAALIIPVIFGLFMLVLYVSWVIILLVDFDGSSGDYDSNVTTLNTVTAINNMNTTMSNMNTMNNINNIL